MARVRDGAGRAPDGPLVEVTVQSLAAGGDGVGPDSTGRMVFVAGTAPGERVHVRVIESKKSYARAELVHVLEPSAARIEPVCALFRARRCGGCQWQHLALPAQHDAKTVIALRELRKAIAGGMELRPIIAETPALAWRRRARLHWIRPRRADRALIGFYAPRSQRVVDVEACPQLTPAVDRTLAILRAELGPRLGSTGEIEVLAAGTGEVHVAIRGYCAPRHARRLVGQGDAVATIVGVTLYPARGDRAAAQPPLEWGKPSILVEPDLRGRADHFAQASEDGNRALLRAVDQASGERSGKRVLELHAGTGNLTRVLRRGEPAEVIAVDSQRVPWLADQRVGVASELVTALAAAGQHVDLAVLDPPRSGAAELIAPLIALRPARIVYVSCDPATLARDLAALHEGGYRAVFAQPIDLMPQTAHVEVVVRLDDPAAHLPMTS